MPSLLIDKKALPTWLSGSVGRSFYPIAVPYNPDGSKHSFAKQMKKKNVIAGIEIFPGLTTDSLPVSQLTDPA
jgi:hypothetical protein